MANAMRSMSVPGRSRQTESPERSVPCSIAETNGKIEAISDVILAHRTWADKGLAWLEASGVIDITGISELALERHDAARFRPAIAMMLGLQLRQVIEPV